VSVFRLTNGRVLKFYRSHKMKGNNYASVLLWVLMVLLVTRPESALGKFREGSSVILVCCHHCIIIQNCHLKGDWLCFGNATLTND
jgi:hypothetical protein